VHRAVAIHRAWLTETVTRAYRTAGAEDLLTQSTVR
jgi:hypothetical protein